MKLSASIFIILLVCLCACKDNGIEVPAVPDAPGVYIAGTSNVDGYVHAVYWKDGVLTTLPGNGGIEYSRAFGIAVSGNDVFVGGSVSGEHSQGELPAFWKNGVLHALPTETKFARMMAITVAHGHVYGCGIENYGVGVWIDEAQTVSKPFDVGSRMTGIAVSGGNLIIAGTDSFYVAGYFKNGQVVRVDASHETITGGIAVSGSDIYLAGSRKINGVYTATYWKNNIPTSLGEGYGNFVAVDGDDVYVAGGNSANEIVFWKNGKIEVVGAGYMSAMAVKAGDVYIVGNSTEWKPGYWKNKNWTELAGLEGSQENLTNSIVVK